MERYPAFRSQSHNVSKHVALMSELSRLVNHCSLMDVSQLEQDLACNDEHSAQVSATGAAFFNERPSPPVDPPPFVSATLHHPPQPSLTISSKS